MPVYNYLLHFNYLPILHLLKQNQEQKKGNFLVSCSPNKVVKGELFSVVQSRSSTELHNEMFWLQDTHLITNNPLLNTMQGHPPHFEQSKFQITWLLY